MDEFGFDTAVDHRSPTFRDVGAATPDGIDVYFEYVEGAFTDRTLGKLLVRLGDSPTRRIAEAV